MNAKTFSIGIAGGITIFFVGFLIYGIVLMDYFAGASNSLPGLVKEPMEIWAIGVGNLMWGILLSYFFKSSQINSGIQGAIHGAMVFFLFSLGTNFVLFGQYNLMPLSVSVADSLCMAVMGGISGAVIGWLLRSKTAKISD